MVLPTYYPFLYFGVSFIYLLLVLAIPITIAIYIFINAPKHGKSQIMALLGLFHFIGLLVYLLIRGEKKYEDSEEGGEWFMAHGAKRGYFFLISFIALGVLYFGVADLIRVLLAHNWSGETISSYSRYYSSDDSFPKTVSLRLATVIVSFPLWILHWFHIQDQLPKVQDVYEQKLTFRAQRGYLYMVSGISALAVLVTGIWLIYQILSLLLGATDVTLQSFGAPLGYGLTSIGVFVYHFFTLRDEKLDALEEKLKSIPTEHHPVKQTAPAEKFCPKCGTKVGNSDVFCGKCGTKL